MYNIYNYMAFFIAVNFFFNLEMENLLHEC